MTVLSSDVHFGLSLSGYCMVVYGEVKKMQFLMSLLWVVSPVVAQSPASGDAKPQAGQQDRKEVRSKALYPKTREAIDKMIETTMSKKGKGEMEAQQEALNTLNVYRFLSGVPANVKLSPAYIKQAQQAAAVCAKHGTIAHTLGSYTDKCNLSAGLSKMSDTVRQYMDDAGANNREVRGHRKHCLSYQLNATGFGQEGRFGAMLVLGNKAKPPRIKTGWSYPGRGFYPKSWMAGNGWSYYAPPGVSMKNSSVAVWKLEEPPKKALSSTDLQKQKKVELKGTFCRDSWVVFEPDVPVPAVDGIYWVTVKAGNFEDGYVVEFY